MRYTSKGALPSERRLPAFDTSILLGHLVMAAYVVLMAIASILIHHTTQQITPILSVFYTFMVCLVFYNLFSFRTEGRYLKIKNNLFNIGMLNMTTAICWLFTFYSLKLISPELFLFIYMGAMPAFSFMLCWEKLAKAAFLFACLVGLVVSYQADQSLIGCMLAFLGGSCGAVYSIYSKRLSIDFGVLDVLSLRFYLIVLVALFANIYIGSLQLMPVNFYMPFLLLAMVSVVLPATLFQIGIKNLHVNKVLSYLPLAPLLCYIVNLITGDVHLNLLQFIAATLLSFALFF